MKSLFSHILWGSSAAIAAEQVTVNESIIDLFPGGGSYICKGTPDAHSIRMTIKDKVISYESMQDPFIIEHIKGTYKQFNCLKDRMNTLESSGTSKVKYDSRAYFWADIKRDKDICLSGNRLLFMTSLLVNSGKTISCTAPIITGTALFLTAPEKVIFKAPLGGKSWLKGIELHPSTAYERPFTYYFNGSLDFSTSTPKGMFEVIGANAVTLYFE